MVWISLRWQMLSCLCLALLFLNAGCDGKVTTKKTAPRPEASAPVQPVPLPSETPKPAVSEKPFSYNSGGRRDPFQSIIAAGKTKGVRGLLPLQQVELSELKLIAIVWGGLGRYAMVQTPDGKGYTLKIGTAVGPNDGFVKTITEKDVIVQENYTDIFGERKIRDVVLDIHPQKEGAE